MSNIRYICLSDIHLGQPDSIMTRLNSDQTGIDLTRASPALEELCKGLRDLIEKNDKQTSMTTLILAGDILEIALAQMNKATMVFQHFIEHLMPQGKERLFDKIIYIPGNHDHHMWELGRETQYVKNYLWEPRGMPGEDLEAPWHKTSLLQTYKGKELPEAYYLKNLIHRYEFLKDFNVSLAYPNFALFDKNKDRCALFHHGHFVQEIYYMMSVLATILFPKEPVPRNIQEIETENFAWIDFFWSAMGRSGKVGNDVGNIYICLNDDDVRNRLIKNLTEGLIKKFGWSLPKPFQFLITCVLKKIAKRVAESQISHEKLIRDADLEMLKKYLADPVCKQMQKEIGMIPGKINFIFGHTHMPYEDQYKIKGFPGSVGVCNTGGWVVENTATERLKGAAAVLADDDLGVTSLRLYNEHDYTVYARDPGGDPQSKALTNYISGLLEKTSLSGKDFSESIAGEVRNHKKYLYRRRRQMKEV